MMKNNSGFSCVCVKMRKFKSNKKQEQKRNVIFVTKEISVKMSKTCVELSGCFTTSTSFLYEMLFYCDVVSNLNFQIVLVLYYENGYL